MQAFNVGNWLAALVTGLLLLWALGRWGHKLPKEVKLDDISRLVVAVFCVAGPLYTTPRFHGWATGLKHFFTSGSAGITTNSTVVTLLAAGLVILFSALYLSKPSLGRLTLLVIATLPLFSNDTMFTIANWWINHLGSWGFREIIAVFTWAAGFPT